MRTITTFKITNIDFLAIIQKELNCNNEKAQRVFKGIFQTVRDSISLEKFDSICGTLPCYIKDLYLEKGKNMEPVIFVKELKNLYLEVVRRIGKRSHYDFLTEDEFISSVKAVLKILGFFLTNKNMIELKMVLPEEFNSAKK